MIIDLLVILVVGSVLALFVLYNKQIKDRALRTAASLDTKVSRSIGLKLKNKHENMLADAKINSNNMYNTVTKFYDDILVHLGFKKSGVNVLSFIFFLSVISVMLSGVVFVFLPDIKIVLILIIVFFILLTVAFKFMALTKYESIEDIMMEAQDLIAMGVDEGVKNAIARYTPSLHPQIRPYFQNFIDAIDREGYSFREAMFKLNNELGDSFNSFANAAIEFEEKGDEKTREIFSPLLDENEIKRDTRQTGNRAFMEIRISFIVALMITVIFALFLMFTEHGAYELLLKTTFGRVLLIIDLVIVVLVFAFITSLKARLLR